MKPPIGNDTTPPATPQVTPPGNPEAVTFMLHATYENAETLGRIEEAIKGVNARLTATENNANTRFTNLDKTVDDAGKRIGSLETLATKLTAWVQAAMVLLPIFGLILWWALGQKVEQALQVKAPAAQEQSGSR